MFARCLPLNRKLSHWFSFPSWDISILQLRNNYCNNRRRNFCRFKHNCIRSRCIILTPFFFVICNNKLKASIINDASEKLLQNIFLQAKTFTSASLLRPPINHWRNKTSKKCKTFHINVIGTWWECIRVKICILWVPESPAIILILIKSFKKLGDFVIEKFGMTQVLNTYLKI